MPKKQILKMAIIIILLSFVCYYIYDNYKYAKKETEIVEKKTEDTIIGEANGNKLKLYYTDTLGNNYYLYGLDKVEVNYGDRILELNRALEAKQITINFMINYIGVDNQELYKDGGSTLIRNDKIALLQCNTLDGNHDYYFGNSNMKYEEGFCKDLAYICSFTKTYQVLNVALSNSLDYSYLTLRQYNGEDIDVVKVDSKLASDIVEDNYYEFTFHYLGDSSSNNIKSIFANNRLAEIKLSDKTGLDQINEEICK